jgi:tRNA-dihydrouridine synthase B
MNLLSEHLNRPLWIGKQMIEKRLVLAPMAFLGNVAFRELVGTYGGFGLLFTEMCSAKRIPRENRYTSAYFRWRDEECSRLVCQILGADPHIMAEAARRIEQEGFFGVDINFGCAQVAICRQHGGAAVLKDPNLASRIVAAVREAVSIPLFVKFRTGWKDDPQFLIRLAKEFEAAGADALTFHPRVAPDRRTRPARWEYIGRVKQAVSIPVFGNGDVFDADGCRHILQSTGCDGVALGRIALARPWVFAEWTDGFDPQPEIFRNSAIQLTRLLENHYEPHQALRRFKRFAFYFSANFRFGHTLYTRVANASNMEAISEVLYRFFGSAPETVSRPNLNFFS